MMSPAPYTLFYQNGGRLKRLLLKSLEQFRESQDANFKRLTRNSSSETIAPRNRSLVIDRHADQCANQPITALVYGTSVPGKPGLVISPFAPDSGYVDEVEDPYTDKIFLTP